MGYREFSPPPRLRELVECAWILDGPAEAVRVLPDGCMDLIRMDGRVVVAGPDTTAFVSPRNREPFVGLRFRPGALPRLLGVPAAELRNNRFGTYVDETTTCNLRKCAVRGLKGRPLDDPHWEAFEAERQRIRTDYEAFKQAWESR